MKNIRLLGFLLIFSFCSATYAACESSQETVSINGVDYTSRYESYYYDEDKTDLYSFWLTIHELDKTDIICGSISCSFHQKSGYINLLKVEKVYRHKGIGEWLFKKAKEIIENRFNHLKNLKVSWTALPFEERNATAMIRLVTWYQKLGGIAPYGIGKVGTSMFYYANSSPEYNWKLHKTLKRVCLLTSFALAEILLILKKKSLSENR